MLAAVRGHDNATKVDDMAHPLCYFLLLLLLLLLLLWLLRLLLVLLHLPLASRLGSLLRRCRSGRPGRLGTPSPAMTTPHR